MCKNKSFKKVVSAVAIVCALQFLCFQDMEVVALGKTTEETNYKDNIVTTNGRDLRGKFKKDSSLCKKLLYDRESDTGKISSKIEQELNEEGIFDDQIESMSEEMLDGIENHDILEAVNLYYQVDKEGDLEIITPEKVDEVISEQYDTELEKVNEDGLLKKIFSSWNVKASAATKAYNYSKNSVNSGVLQQGIMVTTTDEKGVLRVWYQATWLSSPHCRGIDICGVCTGFGTPEVSTIDTSYYYNYTVTDVSPKGGTVEHKEKTVTPKTYTKTNGVIVSQNLFSQWSKIESSTWYPFSMTLKEYIKIEYDLYIPSSRYKDRNVIVADYWHKKDSTTYDISPTFSSDGSISLGLTATQNSTYKHISPNLAENFTYSSSTK